MDLETLFTTVYVLVCDWYKQEIAPHKPVRPGPKPRLTDAEVLTLAVVGQWQVGVPWRTERGLVRWALGPVGRKLFPAMLRVSQFNARVRDLWGVFIALQQYLAEQQVTPEDLYVCVDCEPLPAYSNGQAERARAHWLFESTLGRGGTRGLYFYGDHLLAVVLPNGAVTGWLLATAAIQDRWPLEGLLSARIGCPQLVGPPPDTHVVRAARPTPPVGFVGPMQAAGRWTDRPYLADRGFNGARWQRHWQTHYQANVVTVPPRNTPAYQNWSRASARWLASHRQIVDTAFAFLDEVLGMKRLNAHSRWGQIARVAAKMAAYNLGLLLNRQLGRPPGALATLIT